MKNEKKEEGKVGLVQLSLNEELSGRQQSFLLALANLYPGTARWKEVRPDFVMLEFEVPTSALQFRSLLTDDNGNITTGGELLDRLFTIINLSLTEASKTPS